MGERLRIHFDWSLFLYINFEILPFFCFAHEEPDYWLSSHVFSSFFFAFHICITMDQVWKRIYLNIFFHHYILGGENIFRYIFTTVFCWGENIFKYIFTTVFCWEKIYLNIFHHRIFGGENIFKYIFTTVFCWEKIYLNIFTTVFLREKIYLNIFSPPYFCWEKIYLNIFSPPYFIGRKYI